MVGNPLKKLKQKTDLLGGQIKQISETSHNQTKLMQQNVDIMKNQSITLQTWADAAITQAEILQGISETVKEISDTLKTKKEVV